MKTRFVESVSWRWLLALPVFAMLLALTLTVNLGSGGIPVASGSSGPDTAEYRVVLGAQPDAAEIDRQVQQMDARRFSLGNRSTSPMIVCPSDTVCAD